MTPVAPTLPHLFIPEDGPPLKEIGLLADWGTFSEVFEVETPKGSHRALKVSRPGEHKYAEVLREAKLLKELQIPNLGTYITHFKLIPETPQAPPQVAILMGLLPQDCFAQFEGGATLKEINRIAKQALEILGHLHSKKMIHGDIKPENMSNKSDNLIIFDLGSTKHESQYLPKRPGGTTAFYPPECMLGLPCTTSRDIWSLGVTLFELYTGEDFLPHRASLADCKYLLGVNMGEPLGLPSNDKILKRGQDFEKELRLCYGGKEVWEMLIYKAARRKYYLDMEAADTEAEPDAEAELMAQREARAVIKLITPMLQLCPERRATANELLQNFETQ